MEEGKRVVHIRRVAGRWRHAEIIGIVAIVGFAVANESARAENPRVRWAAQPAPADVAAVTPPGVGPTQVVGYAGMHCSISVDGALKNCGVIKETPTGYGLGAALLSLAGKFRVLPGADGAVATETNIYQSFPPADVHAEWAEVPQASLIKRHLPKAIAAAPYMEKATVSCEVLLDGRLSDCEVVFEDPTGVGVGAAVVGLTPYFKFKPGKAQGRPVYDRRFIPMMLRSPANH